MKGRPQFNNFSGGELDPRLHARTDLPEYQAGVKTMRNMIAQNQGPAVTRGGTRVIGVIGQAGIEHSIIRFAKQQRGEFEAINFHTVKQAGPLSGFTQYASISGVLFDSATRLEDNILLDVGNANVTLTKDADNGGIVWNPGRLRFFTAYNAGTTATHSARLNVPDPTGFTTYTVSIRFDRVLDLGGAVLTISASEVVAAVESEIMSFDVDNTNYCTFEIDFDNSSTAWYIDIELTSSYDTEVSIISITGGGDLTGDYDGLFVATYPATVESYRHVVDITAEQVILLHPGLAPMGHAWTATGHTPLPIAFTSAPAEWVAGNYPSICAFYKGRSWWSGCPSDPSTIWASRVNTAVSGDWFDMTTGALDTDAIVLVRNKPGRITNMVAGSELLVMTDVDSFLLDAQAGVLTPSDVYEVLQSGVGATTIDPLNLGSVIIYVASDERSIMVTRYVENINAWRDIQVNKNAEHLFKNKTIQNIQYLANQIQQLFVLFTDGTMVMGVKDPLSEVFGWSSFDFSMTISDIATFHRAGTDFLLIASITMELDGRMLLTYEPEYELDFIQTVFFPDGVTNPYDLFRWQPQIYQGINERVRIRYANDAVFASNSTYWTVTLGTAVNGNDGHDWYDYHATFDTVLLTATGGWTSSYRPKYILFYVLGAGDIDVAVWGAVNPLLEETVTSGSYIRELSQTEDIAGFAAEATSAFGGVGAIIFSDDYELLVKLQQFYRIRTETDGDLEYVGMNAIGANYQADFTTTKYFFEIAHGFDQELETLTPQLPTSIGTGRASVRGNNRVHVNLLDSEAPTVDGKTPKVDKDATLDSTTNRVDGYVRTSLGGYTRNMTTTVKQLEPKRLEVSEIVYDITQSEDG